MSDFVPDEIDRQLIAELQGEMPVTSRPFARVADKLGLEEEQVLKRLRKLQEKGVLRRIAPLVSQKKSGFNSNAMVVWQVPEAECDSIGRKLSKFDFISHCYRRPAASDWPYQIFTVVHAKNEEDLRGKVDQLKTAVDSIDCKILRTQKKLKKASLQYF